MDNLDETKNEKPKGNMLQNENREDEASPENLLSESHKTINKKEGENIAQQPPVKKAEE